jgi:regulator of nonsense transcripts 1
MVVRIARRYKQHNLKFCIITFYDLQRAAIAEAMEDANFPTDCVYNVDSFQGMDHPPHIGDALISTMAGRERSRSCDVILSPDTTTRILEVATPHERRPDSLPQRDGSHYQ